MLNIEKIAIEAVKNALNSEALQKSIEEKITETITRELTDQFRSYSEFGKAFDAAIKENMKIDLDNVGFMEYNHFVATTIKDKFKSQLSKPTENQIENMINDVIQLQPETVSLDDIVQKLKDAKSEYEHDHSGSFALWVTRGSESYNNGKLTIHFDEDSTIGWAGDKEKQPKDCGYSFEIDMNTKKVIGFNLGHRGNTGTATVKAWRHCVESSFFKMYATGSKIDLGDYEESIMEMAPGDELSGYDDLDIDTSYEWHED